MRMTAGYPDRRTRLPGRMSDLQERTRWEPAEAEARIFARWLESGLFHPEPDRDGGRELLDRGPAAERHRRAAHGPRAQRLGPGHADPLPPDAGPAHEVDARHRPRRASPRRRRSRSCCGARARSREELGREAFIERVWRWREEYGGIIFGQFQRLGASLDYEEERFTLDPGYVRAVMKVFVDLYDKGLIYRDNYMVNWDPGSRSAISDLEVEDREVTDTLYYVDYPLASRRRLAHGRHGAAGDDAGRHRDRRAPRRRALHAARGGDGDPADRRAPAADHRRPLRQARVRHRRAEDHARATTRTTSRSAARTGSRRSS